MPASRGDPRSCKQAHLEETWSCTHAGIRPPNAKGSGALRPRTPPTLHSGQRCYARFLRFISTAAASEMNPTARPNGAAGLVVSPVLGRASPAVCAMCCGT